MKNARVFTLALIICLLFTALCPAAAAEAAPDISARNAIVIEQNSGEVIFEKAADEIAAPASTTKIMTLLLACEAVKNGDVTLDDMVTATAADTFIDTPDASNAGISEGETLVFRDLCYCAMLPSANEAANIIASHVAGSIEAFVKLMNEKASELGLENTRFVNTNGLPAANHYTTARELAIITTEALKYDLFRELCGTAEYTVPPTNLSGERELSNSNALINTDSFYGSSYFLEGAYGVKTGFTNAAGCCLVSAVKRGDLDLLCVVLGSSHSETNYSNFTDTIKLVEYCEENFHFETVLRTDEIIDSITVEKGKQDTLSLSPANEIELFFSDNVDIGALRRIVDLDYDTVPAPVKKGAVIGQISIADAEGELLGSSELLAAENVEASFRAYVAEKIDAFFAKLFRALIIIAPVTIVAAFAVVFIRHKRKGRKSER